MAEKIHYKICPLCTHADISKQFDIMDYSISHEDFEIWKCSSCGFKFTQHVPDQLNIAPYYESEDYISHSDNKTGVIHRLYHLARKYMLTRKRNLVSKYIKGKSILDIGSGTGYFPNIMQESGFNVLGVEINDDARRYSKDKFGLEVITPIDFEKNELNQKFDAVTMWHVFEHIYDLHGYLRNISSILNNEGILILALPNPNSYDASHYSNYWAGYDVPRHLWHFTVKDIQLLADQYGFSIIAKKRMPFDSFYVSLLSERYKASKLALIFGFVHGGISYLKSLFDVNVCSSIIYVLKKQK